MCFVFCVLFCFPQDEKTPEASPQARFSELVAGNRTSASLSPVIPYGLDRSVLQLETLVTFSFLFLFPLASFPLLHKTPADPLPSKLFSAKPLLPGRTWWLVFTAEDSCSPDVFLALRQHPVWPALSRLELHTLAALCPPQRCGTEEEN